MSMLASYILYYFIVISTSIIVFFSDWFKKSGYIRLGKFIFWTALILPVLISGFRYGVGTDYFSYADKFHQITSSGNLFHDVVNSRYEPGWVLLNYIVKLIFGDVKYFFIITSLLIWAFNFKAIYENRSKVSMSVAVLILLCTLYNPSFNMIRQSLAASILMMSVKPILSKSPKKFFLLILFAFSIHYTSLIFLPAYWIVNSRTENLSLIKKIFSFIGAILFIILINPIIEFITNFDAFSAYSQYNLDFEDFGIGNIIIKLPIIIIMFLNINKMKQKDNPFHKLIIFYFISLIIEYLGYFADYIDRLAIYFEMLQIFILAAIVKVQNNKYEKLLYSFIVVLYFVGWFTYNFIILNRHATNPFNWL